MPLFPGLLVSSKRNFEKAAASEIYYVLTKELGYSNSDVTTKNSRISGLVTVKINPTLDLNEIMKKIIALEEEKPYFMHCLKIKPIQHKITADLDKLQEHIKENLLNSFEGSFKVEVNKRHASLSSSDIITVIAEQFSNPVSLDNPDNVFLIEIIADNLGISIIPPEFIFSTQAVKDQEEESDNWFL